MNKRTDNERLLADVLAPEADSGFSAALLAQTLQQAQQRRRFRQLRRYGGTLAVLLAVTALVSSYLQRPGKSGPVRLPSLMNYQLVVNQSLVSGQIVSTQPLAPNQLAVSTATVREVQTVAGSFREVGDDELMALAAPQVVALVRRSPHEAELIFVSPLPENSDSPQN